MDEQEIRRLLDEGGIKARDLEEVVFAEVLGSDEGRISEAGEIAERLRADYIASKTGVRLDEAKRHEVKTLRSIEGILAKGIEMKVGGAVIPLGVAGPVRIDGVAARGEYHIPCATNEAALVAGLNRGMKVINRAGGIRTIVTRDTMTRAPLLEAPGIVEAADLVRALANELGDELLEIPSDDAPFCRLVRVEPFQLGRKVWVRFVCRVGDAMGMNTVTNYAAKLVKEILRRHPSIRLVALSGNLCSDKKATALNVLHGRGKGVETEVIIRPDILADVYGAEATPEAVASINQSKNLYGSALAGTVTGFNANAANTVAAVFAATGQDLAQVVESSTCFDQAVVDKTGLRFGVTLPCLEVGVHGGGTGFGTARECLTLMGCAGVGRDADDNENARRLAELIGAAVTAQELNLLCTLAGGFELASSHVRLAQGRVDGDG